MACLDNVSLLLYGSYRKRDPAEEDHVYVEKKKKKKQSKATERKCEMATVHVL